MLRIAFNFDCIVPNEERELFGRTPKIYFKHSWFINMSFQMKNAILNQGSRYGICLVIRINHINPGFFSQPLYLTCNSEFRQFLSLSRVYQGANHQQEKKSFHLCLFCVSLL